MSKLAVIFPGIGYTADKPLLYYSRRIAADHGYEIRIMDYIGFPSKVKGDRKRMVESFSIALQQAEEMLSDTDLTAYEDILFIGKSIGTIVAAKIASESPAKDRIRQILYTPLEDTFRFPLGKAIVYTGDDDPWVGGRDHAAEQHSECPDRYAADQREGAIPCEQKDKSPILGICSKRDIPCALFPRANHSLETPDVFADLKDLYRIMRNTERFILEERYGV